METEDSLERVTQDISNHANNLKMLHDEPDLVKEGALLERQLSSEKERFKRLGMKLAALEAKSLFLQSLEEGNWADVTADPVEDSKLQDVQEKYKQEKKVVRDLENENDELADTLLAKHEELGEKLKVLETKLAASKAKKQKLEIMEEKSREMAAKLSGVKSSKHVLKELKEKQSEACFAIKQCDAAIDSVEHCKNLLQNEMDRLQEHVDGVRKELQIQEAVKEQSDADDDWFSSTVELLSSLGGVTVKCYEGNSIVLEIRNESELPPTQQANEQTEQQDNVVLLTMKFNVDQTGPAVFSGGQVNLESLPIDDLVSEACCGGNLVALVLNIKTRLMNHKNVLTEIQELQRKYATDWEPTLGRIRVMLGTSGKIVCTLKVDSLNPNHVTLLGVEDTSVKTELPLMDFKFTECPSNLSKCVERLHEHFSPE